MVSPYLRPGVPPKQFSTMNEEDEEEKEEEK